MLTYINQINCTSRLNFAASQLSDAWPASPPTGAMTSNEIHAWAVSQNQLLRGGDYNYSAYPDLASQIQSYISLPAPRTQPQATIFILSFGFWDIYDFAQLNFPAAQNVTDTSIDFLFDQLDVLYAHFATKLYPITEIPQISNSTNGTAHSTSEHKFQVIIPRILDPTLLPGWVIQRPVPAKPSSVAEQQKNAIYLAERWNQGIENKMGAWMERTVDISPAPTESSAPPTESTEPETRADVRENATEGQSEDGKFQQFDGNVAVKDEKTDPKKDDGKPEEESNKEEPKNLPKKDIFYHDSASILLDIILEHQLEDEGLSDALGLGKGESPYESVSIPCMRPMDLEEDITELVTHWKENNGMLICKEPEDFMWWDAWSLGGKGKKMVGEAVGEIVREGKSLRAKKEGKGKSA